jgi:hypothetical protein
MTTGSNERTRELKREKKYFLWKLAEVGSKGEIS